MAVITEGRTERVINSVRQHPEHVLAAASIVQSIVSILVNVGVLGGGDPFLEQPMRGQGL